MNLKELAERVAEEYELGDSDKDHTAVRQQLDRILKRMPEAQSWYEKQGRKGTWNIPEDAVCFIVDSDPVQAYALKRLGKETRAYRALIAVQEEAQQIAQAEREWLEELAEKTADDAAEEWADNPYRTPSEVVAAEETTLLLRGIIGLLAAQDGKIFDYEAFRKAHRGLVSIKEQNACERDNDNELSAGAIWRKRKQEELLSDLRNFFI